MHVDQAVERLAAIGGAGRGKRKTMSGRVAGLGVTLKGTLFFLKELDLAEGSAEFR